MFEVAALKHENVSNERIEHALDGMYMKSKLSFGDRISNIGVRFGFYRDSYMVKPGLYALGQPTKDSDIIVTCNYKLTVDLVRSTLKDDYWLLIIDTKGINVWCAAGKGSFGTAELIYAIDNYNLKEYASKKRLILPQLSAPGVQSHLVTKVTGYQVVFATVRIEDLEEFIRNDYNASKEMKVVTFKLKDRMVLTPLEVIRTWKVVLPVLLLTLILPILNYNHLVMVMLSVVSGAILFPALLPIRPYKMFYKNGILLGLAVNGFIMIDQMSFFMMGWYILCSAFSGYLALNYTGSTTFTSLSGVKKEMEEGIPVLSVLGVISGVLIILGIVEVML